MFYINREIRYFREKSHVFIARLYYSMSAWPDTRYFWPNGITSFAITQPIKILNFGHFVRWNRTLKRNFHLQKDSGTVVKTQLRIKRIYSLLWLSRQWTTVEAIHACTHGRTEQFKSTDEIIKWMIAQHLFLCTRHIFQACPVWIYTHSNITNIIKYICCGKKYLLKNAKLESNLKSQLIGLLLYKPWVFLYSGSWKLKRFIDCVPPL
jgi:hypothetical protein